jgi:CelD/BcsL family acetyltransferase involved in cellulose biosynthesis
VKTAVELAQSEAGTSIVEGARGMLTSQAYRGGVEVIERLADEWRLLCESSPQREPWLRPEFLAAHVRAFDPASTLLVVTVRHENELRGLLPLREERIRWRGVPVTRLVSVTNDQSPRFDLVYGPHDRHETVREIWRALRTMRHWDVMELHLSPRCAAAEQLLRIAAQDGHLVGSQEWDESPYIDLPPGPDAPNAVLARCHASFRHSLRRSMRRLEELGPVRLERFSHADPLALERFYALEQATWKGTAGTAIACDPQLRQFYDEIARQAGRYGYFSLYMLQCGDRTAAIQYGFEYRGRYCGYKSAYDQAFRQCSPGQLILREILADLTARGFSELDLMGSPLEYKLKWAPSLRPLSLHYVFQRSATGRMMYAARFQLRPALRRLAGRLRRRSTNGAHDALEAAGFQRSRTSGGTGVSACPRG